MVAVMRRAIIILMAGVAAASVCGVGRAQLGQSAGTKFLTAVKEEKNGEVVAAVNEGGTSIINTRDFSSRETALHIVAKRGDLLYTRFLLQKGANPDLRDVNGSTPLLIAVSAGHGELIAAYVAARANVNQGNDSGETPLIKAVQRRDTAMVRELIAAGADPDQADSLAGKSARIYAEEDTRTPGLAKIFADTPKRARRPVAGPSL